MWLLTSHAWHPEDPVILYDTRDCIPFLRLSSSSSNRLSIPGQANMKALKAHRFRGRIARAIDQRPEQ